MPSASEPLLSLAVGADAEWLIATGGELGASNVLAVSANPDSVETRHQFQQIRELAAAAGGVLLQTQRYLTDSSRP